MSITQWVRRGLVAAGAVAVLASVPLAVAAQEGHGSWHGRHGFMGGFAGLRQLDLTDDQRQQIRAAMQSHREEFKAIADRVRKAREAQQAAIEQVPVNEPQIRAASSELAASTSMRATPRG